MIFLFLYTGIISVIIALDALMETWLKFQLKWRLLIGIIIMYGLPSYVNFSIQFFFYEILKGYFLFVCMQLAFFTTRQVSAMEELTWVSGLVFVAHLRKIMY